jgi:hypothetical protein
VRASCIWSKNIQERFAPKFERNQDLIFLGSLPFFSEVVYNFYFCQGCLLFKKKLSSFIFWGHLPILLFIYSVNIKLYLAWAWQLNMFSNSNSNSMKDVYLNDWIVTHTLVKFSISDLFSACTLYITWNRGKGNI